MTEEQFARQAVQRGWLTLEQAFECQRLAVQRGGKTRLWDILLERGFLTPSQIAELRPGEPKAWRATQRGTRGSVPASRISQRCPIASRGWRRRLIWASGGAGLVGLSLLLSALALGTRKQSEPPVEAISKRTAQAFDVARLESSIDRLLEQNEFGRAWQSVEKNSSSLAPDEFLRLREKVIIEGRRRIHELGESFQGGGPPAPDAVREWIERLESVARRSEGVPELVAVTRACLDRARKMAEQVEAYGRLAASVQARTAAGDFLGASVECERAIRNRGLAYPKAWAEALRSQVETEHEKSSSAPTPEHAAEILRKAHRAVLAGEASTARWLLARARELNAESPAVDGLQAMQSLAEGDPDGARAAAERALARLPEQAEANYAMGVLARRGGELQRAAGYFGRAVRSNPGFATGRLQLAETLAEMGSLPEAILEALEAKARGLGAEELLQCRRVLIHANLSLGFVGEAVREATEWIQTHPRETEPLLLRGDAHLAAGRGDEAERDYRRAQELNPRSKAAEERLASMGRKLAERPLPGLAPPPLDQSGGVGEPPPSLPPAAGSAPARANPQVERAMGRIANDLTQLEGPGYLVLLLDTSLSMENEVRLLGQRVSDLLGSVFQKKELRAAVATYDVDVKYVTNWESSTRSLAATIGRIRLDGTGSENLFAAVERVAGSMAGLPGARHLFVLTDETGSDALRLETAIKAAKAARVRVWVLGPEAAFSWPLGFEKGNVYSIATDVGTDSIEAEVLQASPIRTYGRKEAIEMANRLRSIDSPSYLPIDLGFDTQVRTGFGPYALERLARETLGECFTIHPPSFAIPAVQSTAPEWCSADEYDARTEASPLRVLVRKIVRSWPQAEGYTRGTASRSYKRWLPTTFWIPSQPAEAVETARELLGTVDDQLSEIQALDQQVRGRETRRWQANLELVQAQLAVLRHDLHQYIHAVLKIKATEVDPYWRLAAADRARSTNLDGYHATAVYLLDKVAKEYPGTPWAATAGHLARRLGGFAPERFTAGRPVEIPPEKPR